MFKKLILAFALLAVTVSAVRSRQAVDNGEIVFSTDDSFVSLVSDNKFVVMDFFTTWW